MTATTLPPTMTPAVARLLWHEALDDWSEHETSYCVCCLAGLCPCRVAARLAELERATWLAWLGARRLAGEAGL